MAKRQHSSSKESTLKNWSTWALIVAVLLYALWFQLNSQRQPIESSNGSVPLQDSRAIPYDKPPSPPPQQPSESVPTFGGYPCSGDCSEDKAGYRWAEQHGITDPDACTGNTGSFIEGCRVYARQRAANLQKN
ncbi:MAG: hypothetical protein ACREUY_02425 [Burkholderiales bacterium]